MRRTILAITALLLSQSVFSQFQLEQEYFANFVIRTILQDGTEVYSVFDENDQQIKILDKDHVLLKSIPQPDCADGFRYTLLRNDILDTEFGIFYSCENNNGQPTIYLMDEEGNVIREFGNLIDEKNDYLITYYFDLNRTEIYKASTLELIKTIEGDIFSNPLSFHNDVNYTTRSNDIDSISIYDENFDLFKVVEFDFRPDIDRTSISGASIIENGINNFYFLVSKFDIEQDKRFAGLIDGDGNTIRDFENIERILFHKYNQEVQVLFQMENDLSFYRYNIRDDETSPIFNKINIPNSISIFSSGKYIGSYVENFLGYIYDYTGARAFTLQILDSNYSYGLKAFTDSKGDEYISYVERVGEIYNTLLFKDLELIQTLENVNNVFPRDLPGLETKLFGIEGNDFRAQKVYGFDTSTDTEIIAKPQENIQIFPNPSNSLINISSDLEFSTAHIVSPSGKILISKTSNENKQLDISHLSNGIYFVKLFFENQLIGVSKFVKI